MLDPRFAMLVSTVFLGIESAAMYWLGHTFGRRSSPDMHAIVTGAGIWSLVLSWTLLIGGSHGVVVFPVPAWLVLGSNIGWLLGLGNLPTQYVWFSPYVGVPWAWLSIACSVWAYVVGAKGGRSHSSRETRMS